MKALSKSTKIMFGFDLLIFAGITSCVLNYVINDNCNLFIRVLAIAFVAITGLFSLFLKGNYKIREFNINFWNIFRLLEGVIFAHIPTIILLLFFVGKITLLKFSLLNIAVIFVCLCLYRLGFHYYLFNFKKVKEVLIVGANERAKVIEEVIKNKYALKMEVAGTCELSELTNQTYSFNPDIVIFTQKKDILSKKIKNEKFYTMPDFYEMVTGKFYIDENTIQDFAYEFHQYPQKIYNVLKRIFDIISSLIILTVTLPITSYIALRVWLIDKGNPFFTQTRVGKDGKTFECYKLRTMYKNDFVPKSGEDVKYAESVKTDDRIIPFCRFVRKARFDEIPQMVNILKGEMSIVGPRAEWADEVKVFKETIPYYSFRQLIVAGWTGWSHINMQPVFSVDEEKERLAYDLYYIKHRNIFWDISILVKAVFLACGGRHK